MFHRWGEVVAIRQGEAAPVKESSHRAGFRRLMIGIVLDLVEAPYADVHGKLKALADRE